MLFALIMINLLQLTSPVADFSLFFSLAFPFLMNLWNMQSNECVYELGQWHPNMIYIRIGRALKLKMM